jgi:transposase-like protein
MKYTIKDFHKQFRNDADCLAYIYAQRYPQGATCEKCEVQGNFYPVISKGVTRRSYACQCGFQIYPTVGTIFHKSPTSLKSWFFAMFLMTASKNGVAAKELERQLGVTYKCAWRMAHQIRQLLKEGRISLGGIVEADETYIGGRRHGKRGRGADGKTAVIGVLERGGSVAAKVVADTRAETVIPHIEKHVDPQSTVMTDDYHIYRRLRHVDFRHEAVRHSVKEYVRGTVHTNSIEGFWSQLKRSINGTFHSVSRKHLQKYVNEFSYRYNRRKSETPIFLHLVAGVAAQHDSAV